METWFFYLQTTCELLKEQLAIEDQACGFNVKANKRHKQGYWCLFAQQLVLQRLINKTAFITYFTSVIWCICMWTI